MKYVESGGPGEVRLPRPEDADRHREGRATCSSAAAASTSTRDSCRSTTRRPTSCWRAATRSACSSSKARACATCLRRLKPDRFDDIIALVALYRPGPMDNIPTYIDRKHGEEPVDYLHPLLEPILKETYGIIDLPGTGDADRRRCWPATRWARPTCCAAPWARRSRRRWTRSATRFVDGADKNKASSRPRRRTDLRPGRQVRRLRLQQEPRRRLCAGRLPDRLSEGELSGRVLRRAR